MEAFLIRHGLGAVALVATVESDVTLIARYLSKNADIEYRLEYVSGLLRAHIRTVTSTVTALRTTL